MSSPNVIGCDIGTQGTTSALYSADGTLISSTYRSHDISFPRPGWAEQDPGMWLRAVVETVRQAAGHARGGPSTIRAISFGTQLDGLVVCGKDGRPLRPAIIWMDRRADRQATAFAAKITPADFYRRTGAHLDSSHGVFKALWVRDMEPELFARACHLIPPGAYILQQVSGVLAADYSNASSFGLLDPRTRTWSKAVLEAAEIDYTLLPDLAAATDAVGTVTSSFAESTGLASDTIVAVGAGDEMAATLGAGVCVPGDVCDIVGTAEPVCAPCSGPCHDPAMLLECHPHADPSAWLLENPGFVSGGNLRWWRDQFCRPLSSEAEGYEAALRGAASVPAGSDGVVFLPTTQGAMTPEWNSAARGVFYGLTLAHTRDHMTRALLEGSAFALRDNIEAMRQAGIDVQRLTIVGGGAKDPLWRQMKADVTGLPVRVPTVIETTATGAALLACVASQLFTTLPEAVAALVTHDAEEHIPNPSHRDIYDHAYERYRRVYFALKPVFEHH